ncbi:hypothetical protein [Candidatus Vondammii sp. HM_W22]|uniref:hypothetical protein n=1 Tax=Candidatus Vondammii sp. HM_W22 TaxID=2687299 RepID=UPI001F13D586|nr:hypothetical protein [Candidatus Vondammii sp. HM_W22]
MIRKINRQTYNVIKPFESYAKGRTVDLTLRQAQFLVLGGFVELSGTKSRKTSPAKSAVNKEARA